MGADGGLGGQVHCSGGVIGAELPFKTEWEGRKPLQSFPGFLQ